MVAPLKEKLIRARCTKMQICKIVFGTHLQFFSLNFITPTDFFSNFTDLQRPPPPPPLRKEEKIDFGERLDGRKK